MAKLLGHHELRPSVGLMLITKLLYVYNQWIHYLDACITSSLCFTDTSIALHLSCSWHAERTQIALQVQNTVIEVHGLSMFTGDGIIQKVVQLKTETTKSAEIDSLKAYSLLKHELS